METRPVLLFALALGACATHTLPDGSPDGTGDDPVTEAQPVDENLRRLSDLQVFEVGELVLDVPDEAFSCYGVCPEWQDEVDAAEIAAAADLQRFADAATSAAAEPDTSVACDETAVANDLAALQDLQIVQIGAFIAEEPANNPMCYNLPCQEDRDAAEAANCLKAQELHAIVIATDGY